MKKTQRFFLPLALIIFAAPFANSQSNTIIDEIFAQQQIQFGHAAYMVLTAAGRLPENATTSDAVTFLELQNWGFASITPSSIITLGDYSNLLMRSFDLSGGLLYSLFPGNRYALRELVYLRAVNLPVWPAKEINGEEALRILTKIIDIKDSKQ